MDLKNCSVCGFSIYPGHGSVFIKNNLKIIRFCRSKCRKLYELKKNPAFLRWTSFNRSIRGLKVNFKNNFLDKSRNSFFFLKKNYNLFLTLQTLYFFKKIEKIKNNRKIDFKIKKIKNK
mmetsp:Transcript_15212/g.38180  ORF Transcript_15212/g.38180 Transcript_15212/m.38180 type:complete len:119 (-) Transcript_15212:2602-2958(-)